MKTVFLSSSIEKETLIIYNAHMNKIKYCVFNMDGLLIDSEKIYLISALECSRIYGYDIPEELILSTMGNNDTETKNRYLQWMGNDFPFDEFLEREWLIHTRYMEEHPLEKKKGVDELLDYLDERKIGKVIATSTARVYADRYLRSVNLYDRFEKIVYGDDLKESKPRPEIYLKAIDCLDAQKDEIFAFEDSANGILSADAAGLKVIHVPDLARIPEEVKEKSFAVLNDLTEAIKLIEEYNRS